VEEAAIEACLSVWVWVWDCCESEAPSGLVELAEGTAADAAVPVAISTGL